MTITNDVLTNGDEIDWHKHRLQHVDTVQQAGLMIENINHLGPIQLVKLIVAKPDKS